MPFIMLVQLLLMVIVILILAAFNPVGFFKMPESMSEVEALLGSPMVLLALTVFVAVIAPLVEELFKTLAVWSLLGLDISEGEGYVAGMLSGTAFALVEGMLYAAQTAMTPGNDWLYFLIGRFGGTLIHIFNGGLIGWALTKTRRDRNLARLLVIYALAFTIHGLWNLTIVLTQLIPSLKGLEVDQVSSNIIMIVLALLVGSGFIIFARQVLKNIKTRPATIVGEKYAS